MLTEPISCRRRDLANSEDYSSSVPSPPLTPLMASGDVPHYPHVDIVPQRSPTVLRPLSSCFAELSAMEYFLAGDEHPGPPNDQETTRHAQSLTNLSARDPLQHSDETRMHTSRASYSCMPSLSHTPSSSYASASSYQRPRISRNPYASSFTTKSIDLVLPRPAQGSTATAGPSSPVQLCMSVSAKSSASTLTSFRVAEAERGSFIASS